MAYQGYYIGEGNYLKNSRTLVPKITNLGTLSYHRSYFGMIDPEATAF